MLEDEAELISQYILECTDTRTFDWKRLPWLASLSDDPAEWLALPTSKTHCIFLDKNNSCHIYPVRPANCRIHLSVDDPNLCTSVNSAAPTNINTLYPVVADLVHNVAMNLENNNSGTLPSMLMNNPQIRELVERSMEEVKNDSSNCLKKSCDACSKACSIRV